VETQQAVQEREGIRVRPERGGKERSLLRDLGVLSRVGRAPPMAGGLGAAESFGVAAIPPLDGRRRRQPGLTGRRGLQLRAFGSVSPGWEPGLSAGSCGRSLGRRPNPSAMARVLLGLTAAQGLRRPFAVSFSPGLHNRATCSIIVFGTDGRGLTVGYEGEC
jgi:hypothetical protein